MSKSGIVNVRMVITEEKILSNIDKVQKMINPGNKKQIIELDGDAYFRDLIDSIKTYLIEYPKKKNFPSNVYYAACGLVEYATNQFEENTKQIEELIRKREININQAGQLREVFDSVQNKSKDWKTKVKQISNTAPEDILQALIVIGKCKSKTKKPDEYNDAVKLVSAKISNLETNLHIEIDIERVEDRTKALSYIGIEIAEALKGIPAPAKRYMDEKEEVNNIQEEVYEDDYLEQTRFEVKPSLWQRIKNSKLVRMLAYISRIKIVLDVPALPEPEVNKGK